MMSGKKRKREGEEEESVRINGILNERYLVLEKVLIGPFMSYSLWLAQDTGNPEKREVKIKVQKRGEKYTKAAKREIAILKRIVAGDQKDEKCVVKLLDAFNHEGHVCMVFESMGQDLSTLIRNGSGIPILRVKQICHDVLVGLDYLQQLSIIHTDLKPQNILLLPENSSDSKCKLIEFGKACGTGEEYDNVIRQREYRCPEVILGCKYSTAADLWSFACIAFELATGNSLFKPATDMEHLALMTELLGVMPRKLALGCPLSSKFYTKDVDLKQYHQFYFKTLDKVLKMYISREQDANDMANFLLPILAFDPEKRPTAGQCLHHAWIDPGPRRLQAVVRMGNIAINADSQGQPNEARALPGED